MSHQRIRGGKALGRAVRELYASGQSDYSLEPLVLKDDQTHSVGCFKDGDSVIFCCRRGEREIQLTEAFVETNYSHFARPEFRDLNFVILTLYHEKFKDIPVAFAPNRIPETLGEVVSRAGLRQLRVAESEKFAHVTFFFNGGSNSKLPGEDDIRIPSRQGAPPEQTPELSLPEVAQQVMEGLDQGYDLIVTNFANGDVIGHTANREAKIKCACAVDKYLGKVVQRAIAQDYVTLITADHGNIEEMLQTDGSPHVAHTTNPVSFILIDPHGQGSAQLQDGGSLRDIAPTILEALGLDQPDLMTGCSLAPGYDWHGRQRVLLIILDGWGIGRSDNGNPIHLANTPIWDELQMKYPHTSIQASGEAVGLQSKKPGNSEAGHMNIGAGRVVPQDDVRLDRAMKDGSFYSNEVLCSAIESARNKSRDLHLIALLSEKSSHGSIDYPLALLKMANQANLDRVYLHMIFDGRSTEPGSAPALLDMLDEKMDEIGLGQIVSGMGRGIALDRDGNYEKTEKAYESLVSGRGIGYSLD